MTLGGTMTELTYALAAGVLLLAAPGRAVEPEAPKNGPALTQNQCYCVQYTGDKLQPYNIARLIPVSAACEKVKYAPEPGSPRDNGLLSCEKLKTCLKKDAEYADKKKIMEEKLAAARKRSSTDCCPGILPAKWPSGCDRACLQKWFKSVEFLTRESAKLDNEAGNSHLACFGLKKPKGKASAAGGN